MVVCAEVSTPLGLFVSCAEEGLLGINSISGKLEKCIDYVVILQWKDNNGSKNNINLPKVRQGTAKRRQKF